METDPFNNMQPQHHYGDFFRVAGATFIGAYIGHRLDNTRFGRWFNTSKLVGLLFKLVSVYCLYLVGVYIYCLIKVW